jgi:outer membrane cobalamin receptor
MSIRSKWVLVFAILAAASFCRAGELPIPGASTAATAGPTPAAQATPQASTPSPEKGNVVPTLAEVEVYGQRIGIARKEISGDDIDNVHNTGDLSASLDGQSGLETQGEGMGKTWSTLAIRGQSFRETVILVNGQRMPESFNLGSIPTEDIERVEVLEGPQALAYGPDALGGVINIITKQPENNPFKLQASGGDFNSYLFQASLPSFNIGGIKNVLSGSWYTTDGYLAPVTLSNGAIYGFTDELHWDISHAASWSMGEDKASLSSSFFRQIGSAPDADNIVAAGTDQYDLDGRQNAWGVQSSFKDTHPLGGNWQLVPSLFGNFSNVIRANPIGADPTSGVYNSYLNQYLDYGGQLYVSGPAGGLFPNLSFGLEARAEDMWSGLYGNPTRQVGSVVAQGTLKLADPLHLDLANHLDDYSDYGLTDSPTGTLVFDATKDWQLHLSVGQGNKVPTFDELYLPPTIWNGPGFNIPPNLLQQMQGSPFFSAFNGTMGNPNLVPEQSLDSELGTDITMGQCLVQLTGFLSYYQNLINPYLNPGLIWTYENISHVVFAGTEDSVKYHLNDILFPFASATWISATDQNGNPIQGRMHFKLVMGVEVKPEKRWSLEAAARYVDRYPVAAQYLTDFYQNNGIPVFPADYWDLSMDFKYTISDHLKGFVSVQNLLNAPMATFQGINLPGRYFEGGLQATF